MTYATFEFAHRDRAAILAALDEHYYRPLTFGGKTIRCADTHGSTMASMFKYAKRRTEGGTFVYRTGGFSDDSASEIRALALAGVSEVNLPLPIGGR